MTKFGKGATFPSESRKLRDEKTGAAIHQLTNHPSINVNLYFLNYSLTPDQKTVVFSSYRSGKPNLFKLAFPIGEITQLTDSDGLHAYSGCISADGTEVFFTRQGAIWAVHLTTLKERQVASFGSDAQLGECSLSASGKWIVTAVKRGGKPGIVAAKSDGSESRVVLEWNRTIIHPQFHPRDETLIEFSGDPAPRMHVIRRDGTGLECLHQHDNNEFIVHETFLDDGDWLAYTVWPKSLSKINLKTKEVRTIANFNAWHITPNKAGTQIVCDTVHPDIGIQIVDATTGQRRTVCHPNATSGGSQWKTSRYAVAEDWARAAEQQASEKSKALSWMEMKVDTVYGPQWTHPHPSFSPDERMVIYTSDVGGHPQVYIAEIP
jgi:Tol biopolymer transport system component